MHARRLVCFLLGLWLGAGLLMTWIENQRSLPAEWAAVGERAAAMLQLKSSPAELQALVELEHSEGVREDLSIWGDLQIGFGVLVCLFLIFGTHENRVAISGGLVILLLTLGQRLLVLPQLMALGQGADLTLATAFSPERARYPITYGAYLLIDAAKGIIAVWLASRLVFQKRRSRSNDPGQHFNPIDKANHRGVNR